MVNVIFYGGGIGAELVSGNDRRLLGLLHDALVDLLSALLAKQSKGPTQIAKIWNRIFIKSGEASVEQTGSQFAVKLAIRPTFMCLSTTQRSNRSGAIPSRPALLEPGERLAKASELKATNIGSSSRPSSGSRIGSAMVAASLKKAKAKGRLVEPSYRANHSSALRRQRSPTENHFATA